MKGRTMRAQGWDLGSCPPPTSPRGTLPSYSLRPSRGRMGDTRGNLEAFSPIDARTEGHFRLAEREARPRSGGGSAGPYLMKVRRPCDQGLCVGARGFGPPTSSASIRSARRLTQQKQKKCRSEELHVCHASTEVKFRKAFRYLSSYLSRVPTRSPRPTPKEHQGAVPVVPRPVKE
jgi:hypothetical protein